MTAKNVAIIGCSNDPAEANAKFAEVNGFTFPLLCDTDMAVAMAYGAAPDANAKSAKRVAALVDENGKVAKYYDPAGKGEFPAQVLADA